MPPRPRSQGSALDRSMGGASACQRERETHGRRELARWFEDRRRTVLSRPTGFLWTVKPESSQHDLRADTGNF